MEEIKNTETSYFEYMVGNGEYPRDLREGLESCVNNTGKEFFKGENSNIYLEANLEFPNALSLNLGGDPQRFGLGEFFNLIVSENGNYRFDYSAIEAYNAGITLFNENNSLYDFSYEQLENIRVQFISDFDIKPDEQRYFESNGLEGTVPEKLGLERNYSIQDNIENPEEAVNLFSYFASALYNKLD